MAPFVSPFGKFKPGHPKRKPKHPKTGVVKGGLDTMPLPAVGFVRFRAVNHPRMGLIGELDGDVTVIGGYGEHSITGRPGNIGITGYDGRQPLQLRIPLLFDRWTAQASVEPEIRMLERLLGLDSHLDAPPALIIEGLGVPHSYSRSPKNRFVLTAPSGQIEWGDDVRYRPSDGHRLFVPCVVNAQLLVRPTSLGAATSNDGGEANSGISVRHYYTIPKTGHPRTIKGIAKKFGKSWQKVRALNPHLHADPDAALPTGLKVRYV